MRIKTLDIFGFKSFSTRQILHLDEGLTAIVGPNGCGKSNVVDALRWVMGEQNARHLRGGQMADIIFCGSEKKAPLGFAEVTLILENLKGLAPTEYNHFTEIAITRRLYKTGESEYEINKQKVRLKDIHEFFLGTGVGSKAYSIIEQGRVNEIISSKPQDRRLIIEEAAGITKYKAKRVLAEKRMEATKQNLSRIIDIKKEVDERVLVLFKEKEKLEKLISLKNQLKNIDLHSASHQLLAHNAYLRFFSLNLENLLENIKESRKSMAFKEQIFEKALSQYIEKAENKRLLEDIKLQHQSTLALLNKDLEFNKESIKNNIIFFQQLYEQEKTLENRKFDTQNSILQDKEILEKTTNDLSILEEKIGGLKESGQSAIDERKNHKEKEQILQKKLLEQASIASRLQGQISAIKAQDEQRKINLKNLQHEKINKEKELEELLHRINTVDKEFSDGQNKHLELKNKIGEHESILNEHNQELFKEKEKLAILQKEKVQISSRFDSLVEIDKKFDWSESGIQKILSSKERDLIKNGVLADAIEVEKGFEQEAEVGLALYLDAALIDHKRSLKDLSDYKKLNNIPTTNFLFLPNAEILVTNQSEFADLISLKDKIKIKDNNFININNFLSLFYLVESLEKALDLWPAAQKKGLYLFTKFGEFFMPNGITVFLGKDKEFGVLKRKKEIEELKERIRVNQNNINLQSDIVKKIELKLRALLAQKENFLREAKPLSSSMIRLEEVIKQKSQEIAKAESDSKKIIQKIEELSTFNTNQDDEAEKNKKLWSLALDGHKKIEEDLLLLKNNEDNIEKNYQKYQDNLKELEIERASLKEKKKNFSNNISQKELNIKNNIEEIEKIKESLAKKSNQELLLNEQERQMQKKIETLQKEINECLNRLEKVQIEVLEFKEKKELVEKELSNIKDKAQSYKDLLHKEELRINNTKNDIKVLCEKILERHQENLENSLHEFHHKPLDEKLAKKELLELKTMIDRMGLVNENAANEYQNFKDRADFLQAQVNDLQSALLQLEEAIKKINKTTEMRFEEAFKEINKQFALVFPRLFNGGQAELVLTDSTDLLSSGVDIMAKPPGKNIQSLELMSGGEKALTAISLLVAIFLIKPSPFCLLDEVDAPLDEANVSRFSKLIKEMSELSQFIVITHNRKTMESADHLYGVTMEERGESKVVSVKINEAFLALKDHKKPLQQDLSLTE